MSSGGRTGWRGLGRLGQAAGRRRGDVLNGHNPCRRCGWLFLLLDDFHVFGRRFWRQLPSARRGYGRRTTPGKPPLRPWTAGFPHAVDSHVATPRLAWGTYISRGARTHGPWGETSRDYPRRAGPRADGAATAQAARCHRDRRRRWLRRARARTGGAGRTVRFPGHARGRPRWSGLSS